MNRCRRPSKDLDVQYIIYYITKCVPTKFNLNIYCTNYKSDNHNYKFLFI